MPEGISLIEIKKERKSKGPLKAALPFNYCGKRREISRLGASTACQPTCTSIRLGFAISALGILSVRMPLTKSALAFSWSRLSGMVNCR